MTTALRRALEAVCPDRVIDREHPRYDATRLLFNGMHDRRPRLIVLPSDREELRRVVPLARESGLPLAVRGAGHNIAGTAGVDDGVVLDLRLLDRVRIDPQRRTARVQGGANWAQFDASASRHGLAVTGGTFDTTGVGGLTLGGGIGHLMGRYGLSCDNVLTYSLVTADGDRLAVDAETEPELDWALRGAGHDFGIVDEFVFRLHPVTTVYGGTVAYPAHEMTRAVELFRRLGSEGPDELVCILLLERYGRAQDPAAVLSVCYSGTDPTCPGLLDKQLRSLEVLDWQVEERPYLSMQQLLGRLPYGLRHYWSARCTDELPDELIAALVERFQAGRRRGEFNDTVYLEAFGGAVRREAERPSAVGWRTARFNVTGMAIWEPAAADEEQIAWARSVARAAEPWGVFGDGYVNYVSDAGTDRAGTARAVRTYGERGYRRLAALKRRLDPDNVFRSTYSIDPAAIDPAAIDPAAVDPSAGE
ncbi:FAD-binding oxidoreductase [Kitasatospora aureofaciens]|uniref:FAD-binding oxidoreductase n=1 Tax=Kitasatospora aureofaciens TaxID=1894 RepID=UPI0037FA14C3